MVVAAPTPGAMASASASKPGGGGGGGGAPQAAAVDYAAIIATKTAMPRLPDDPPVARTGWPYVAQLKELCIELFAKHFNANPSFESLPPDVVERVVDILGADLPIETAGELIDDESYWERRAVATFSRCDPVRHGRSWKQLFFERHCEAAIRAHDATNSTAEENDALARLLSYAGKYARALDVVCLPGRFDAKMLFRRMPWLASLGVRYKPGEEIGMGFDKSLFGATLSDVKAIAAAVESAETLLTLDLAGNLIDDEKARCVFLTLVPIRPRSRGERRSLRTLPGVSLRPPLAHNPDTPRRLSTPTDAFQLQGGGERPRRESRRPPLKPLAESHRGRGRARDRAVASPHERPRARGPDGQQDWRGRRARRRRRVDDERELRFFFAAIESLRRRRGRRRGVQSADEEHDDAADQPRGVLAGVRVRGSARGVDRAAARDVDFDRRLRERF